VNAVGSKERKRIAARFALASVDRQNFSGDFFGCLFTPAERKDFANRWLLVKEIDKGTTQREIARRFGMSLCKITRGSRELHKEESAFRRTPSTATCRH